MNDYLLGVIQSPSREIFARNIKMEIGDLVLSYLYEDCLHLSSHFDQTAVDDLAKCSLLSLKVIQSKHMEVKSGD